MGREEDGGEDRGAKEEAIDRGCPAVGTRGRETVVSSPLGLERQGLGWGWAEVLAVLGQSPQA